MSNLSDFYIKDKMLLKYHGADDHVVIPETVTTIRSGAFFLIKTRVKSIDISDKRKST